MEKINIKEEDYIYLLFGLQINRTGSMYWFQEFYEQDRYNQSPVQSRLWFRDAFRHPDKEISRYAYLADGRYFFLTVEKTLWYEVIKEKIREVSGTDPFRKYYGYEEGRDYNEFPTFEALITHVGKYFEKLSPLEASIMEKERYRGWLDTLLQKNVLPTCSEINIAQTQLHADIASLKKDLKELLQSYLTIEVLNGE